MKVMVIVKATPNSEKGIVVDEKTTKMFADMGNFNNELVKAGIMQMGEGLKPSSHGRRVTFTDGGHAAVIDGPFAETKELVAGFWIWEVKSLDEAVAWAKRCPNPMPGEEGARQGEVKASETQTRPREIQEVVTAGRRPATSATRAAARGDV